MAKKNWDELYQKYSAVADSLKLPIDKQILPVVIALNAHGLKTVSSCEGHLDRGEAYPFVDITPVFDKKFDKVRSKIGEISKDLLSLSKNDPHYAKELEQDVKKYNSTYTEIETALSHYCTRLLELLDQFYEKHQTDNYNRIIVTRFRDFIRLESQGGCVQRSLDKNKKKNNLLSFRKEFAKFGEYLRERYESLDFAV